MLPVDFGINVNPYILLIIFFIDNIIFQIFHYPTFLSNNVNIYYCILTV